MDIVRSRAKLVTFKYLSSLISIELQLLRFSKTQGENNKFIKI